MTKRNSKKAVALATGSAPTSTIPTTTIPRPRLHKLHVSNFRCIGSTPVEIELDDIVVLVGPNNAGKSSIIRAYEVVMEHGSSQGKLTLDDFPNGKVDPAELPTIELETVVFERTAPGDTWIRTDPVTGEMFIREKWTWSEPGDPKKVGWDVSASDWHPSMGPWGTPQVAQANRPKPHHVTAFQDPIKQAMQVAEILKDELTKRVKEAKKKNTETEAGPFNDYEKLLEHIKQLQKAIAADAMSAVEKMQTDLGRIVGEVFPGYSVTLDARPEDVDQTVSLFKASPLLRMGPAGGHQSTLERQGSGACRTLLWAALRILAEQPGGATTNDDRPHLLLMDEPEICLHPDAVRDACRVLYNLPQSKNWQVMITTHSPVFIDLSRDNTSIVRVERTTQGTVQGTTIFRPKRAKLDDDDRAELKLLNQCDPYVAEFFFGGRTVIVEGDTEYTAFRYLSANDPETYKGIHIVRARGKACIKSLCKILNQFGKPYAVLHDADRMKFVVKSSGVEKTNAMWTENENIAAAVDAARQAGRVRLLASIPNFEEAFFGEESKKEKPYAALARLRTDTEARSVIASLLDALIDPTKSIPKGAIEWKSIGELEREVSAFDNPPTQ